MNFAFDFVDGATSEVDGNLRDGREDGRSVDFECGAMARDCFCAFYVFYRHFGGLSLNVALETLFGFGEDWNWAAVLVNSISHANMVEAETVEHGQVRTF